MSDSCTVSIWPTVCPALSVCPSSASRRIISPAPRADTVTSVVSNTPEASWPSPPLLHDAAARAAASAKNADGLIVVVR